MRIVLSILVLVISLASAWATEPTDSVDVKPLRPVFAAYTYEVGASNLADTYLTPLKYSGWHMGLHYDRMQAMGFNPENWVMRLRTGLHVDKTMNHRRNATMWYWGVDFSWSMMRRWRLQNGLSAGIGGEARLDAGCYYNTRNGNNPAAAKAAITMGLTGYAAWNGHIGRIPLTLRYQPSMPLVGAFFSPSYGELYYEIYLGNHSGLVHPAWVGNYFWLENLLTADIHLGNTSLRVGYSGTIHTTRVNNITTRRFVHAAVIGLSGEWLSVNPRKMPSKEARIISATY